MADLATSADLEAFLQRAVPADTARVALANASSLVRGLCGWVISREATTFLCDGPGGFVLSLPTLLLVDVTELRVEGQVWTPGQQWRHSLHGQLTTARPLPDTPGSVEVDAVHGYEPVPDAVRAATLAIAAREIANPEHARTASAGTVTRVFSAPVDGAMLAPFRIPLRP